MLYEHFRAVGPVVSVRVCIDSTSQKSLGYGYVNYQGAADADRAIDQLNGSRLADRVINVARVLRDPTLRKSGVTNIVVKGLPGDADGKQIKEVFSRFGNIVSIKIATDDTGKPRGLAYIMFDREQSASQAVQEVNGQKIAEDGQALVVERYRTPAAQAAEAALSFTNLYIRNLNPSVTDAQLSEAFGRFGTITSAKVRTDTNDQNRNLGFGWVAFETHESAAAAAEALNEKSNELTAEGQTLCVRRFMSKKERQRQREMKHRERIAAFSKYPNLYIKNFDDSTTEERLRALF
jgi:polyadenylate-binding protein